MDETKIRVAAPQDAEELLTIYAPYVLKTAITCEYDVPETEKFRGRIENTLQKYPYLVAERAGEVIGYVYASAFRKRVGYRWDAETSLYIRGDRRHTGAGRLLYEALEEALTWQNVINLYACVTLPPTETDEYLTNNSRQFHEHMGYRCVGLLENCEYKFGRWYHLSFMEKRLAVPTASPAEFRPFSEIRESWWESRMNKSKVEEKNIG